MRAKWAGIAGLIAVTAWSLTACGQAGASTQAALPARSAGGGAAATASLSLGASARASGTPAGIGSEFPWGWFWLAAGIAAVAGLTVWLLMCRPRPGAAAGWQARVADAYAKGAALHDAMAAAETPGVLAAGDAALRWSDIQRRADDYSELLYGMEQAAPGDQERLMVAGLIASLQAARSAMDAERSARSADGSLSGIVHDRLAYFASALSSLRQPDVRPA